MVLCIRFGLYSLTNHSTGFPDVALVVQDPRSVSPMRQAPGILGRCLGCHRRHRGRQRGKRPSDLQELPTPCGHLLRLSRAGHGDVRVVPRMRPRGPPGTRLAVVRRTKRQGGPNRLPHRLWPPVQLRPDGHDLSPDHEHGSPGNFSDGQHHVHQGSPTGVRTGKQLVIRAGKNEFVSFFLEVRGIGTIRFGMLFFSSQLGLILDGIHRPIECASSRRGVGWCVVPPRGSGLLRVPVRSTGDVLSSWSSSSINRAAPCPPRPEAPGAGGSGGFLGRPPGFPEG